MWDQKLPLSGSFSLSKLLAGSSWHRPTPIYRRPQVTLLLLTSYWSSSSLLSFSSASWQLKLLSRFWTDTSSLWSSRTSWIYAQSQTSPFWSWTKTSMDTIYMDRRPGSLQTSWWVSSKKSSTWRRWASKDHADLFPPWWVRVKTRCRATRYSSPRQWDRSMTDITHRETHSLTRNMMTSSSSRSCRRN